MHFKVLPINLTIFPECHTNVETYYIIYSKRLQEDLSRPHSVGMSSFHAIKAGVAQ